MAARRTTGLSGLDAQMGGGIPEGSVSVLFGAPMNALELFGYHFAAGGTSLGNATFVSTDRTATEIEAGVKRVGGDPEKLSVIMLPSDGNWHLPEMVAGQRVVVDDAASIIDAVGFQEFANQLRKLRNEAHAVGAEALLILTEGLVSESDAVKLRSWADGAMELGFDRQGFGLYPFLKVTKMRGVPDSSRFILFKEIDQGLFIESTRRVF